VPRDRRRRAAPAIASGAGEFGLAARLALPLGGMSRFRGGRHAAHLSKSQQWS